MRRVAFFLLTSTALSLAAVVSASSADLGRRPVYKAPPPPLPVVYNWSGFYVGLNAGGTWAAGDACNTLSPSAWDIGFPHGNGSQTAAHLAAISTAGTGCQSNSNNAGFIGGGQIGYNWQFTNWVFGVETDIQGISHSNSGDSFTNVVAVGSADPSNYIASLSADKRVDWLGTLRGRLGVLATPTALIYVTGGLAYGGVKTDASINIVNDVYNIPSHTIAGGGSGSASETKAGWTVGGGLEWMFAPQWSVKAEYLYYDLGSQDSNYTILVHDNASGLNAEFAGHASADFKGHIARAGINYHF